MKAFDSLAVYSDDHSLKKFNHGGYTYWEIDPSNDLNSYWMCSYQPPLDFMTLIRHHVMVIMLESR